MNSISASGLAAKQGKSNHMCDVYVAMSFSKNSTCRNFNSANQCTSCLDGVVSSAMHFKVVMSSVRQCKVCASLCCLQQSSLNHVSCDLFVPYAKQVSVDTPNRSAANPSGSNFHRSRHYDSNIVFRATGLVVCPWTRFLTQIPKLYPILRCQCLPCSHKTSKRRTTRSYLSLF